MKKTLLIFVIILLLGCVITKGEVVNKFTIEQNYQIKGLNYTRYYLILTNMRRNGIMNRGHKEVMKSQYDSVAVGDYIDLLEDLNK